LFDGLTPATAQRADRLRNTPSGLAASLRATGTGTQTPLWERLGDIEVPVLVLTGEHDDKFRALGDRLVSLLPAASCEVIPGAGHSVHLEQPVATADAVARWVRAPGRP
jgi:pimeloyl-ACP methyl ester carboxylesterase